MLLANAYSSLLDKSLLWGSLSSGAKMEVIILQMVTVRMKW